MCVVAFFQAAGKLAHIACELQGGLPSAMFTCPSHGLGFRVGFGFQDLGFRGLGLKVWGLGSLCGAT